MRTKSKTYFFLDNQSYIPGIFTSKKLHMKPVSGLCSIWPSTAPYQTGHGFYTGQEPTKTLFDH